MSRGAPCHAPGSREVKTRHRDRHDLGEPRQGDDVGDREDHPVAWSASGPFSGPVDRIARETGWLPVFVGAADN